MLHNNPHFNYQMTNDIFNIKQKESDTLVDTITHMMEIFHNIYYGKMKRHVYFISKEIKYTQDIDPSHFLILKYAVSNIQTIVIELPIIKNGDSIMLSGNMYNPILQMIDRPLILKKKNNTAVLMTNLGNFYTSPIVEDKLIRVMVSVNKKFMPPILIWFLAFLGLKGFEDMTGVKIIIDPKDYNMCLREFFSEKRMKFDLTNLKEEFKDPKFELLLKQIDFLPDEVEKPNISDKASAVFVKEIINGGKKGWEGWLGAYDGPRILSKVAVHQNILAQIDIFSSHFMKEPDVVKEMLRLFSKDVQPLDLKDITVKRFRCYECFLIVLMKHLYNLGMNCMYNKITSVSQEKRLRIYDNASANQLTSYDGVRNNSIMRMTEMTKITQTGEGGYTSDMFVGSARDIHESQYGTLCPVTTPDREKCGVTLYLAPSKVSKFPEMYYWPKNSEHKEIRLPLKNAADYEIFLASLPSKDKQDNEPPNIEESPLPPSEQEEKQEPPKEASAETTI